MSEIVSSASTTDMQCINKKRQNFTFIAFLIDIILMVSAKISNI